MLRPNVRVGLRRTRCEHMSSGLPLKADIPRCSRHVANVPLTEITVPPDKPSQRDPTHGSVAARGRVLQCFPQARTRFIASLRRSVQRPRRLIVRIGSIRRECLDHIVVCGERHNGTRTHLSLNKDAPISRSAAEAGRILCRPILGGLHHQYGRT